MTMKSEPNGLLESLKNSHTHWQAGNEQPIAPEYKSVFGSINGTRWVISSDLVA